MKQLGSIDQRLKVMSNVINYFIWKIIYASTYENLLYMAW
jgi:hypothetical protein